jgi:surface polysaccharide O-acyltransferase-like enzyme
MDAPTPKKEYTLWADLIRVVATVLVVIVHVSGQITNVWGEVPDGWWFLANIYGGIARICVPLFFMISGYLLLPRSESLGTFYRKRIPKLLIPLIVWSLVYLGWFCEEHRGACTPSFIQDLLLVRGAYYHLWFLRALLGIYLILPVLRLMVQPDADRKILWYWVGLWLMFQTGLALAKQFWGFQVSLNVPLATGFIGFFLLGYLLGSWNLSRSIIILAASVWVLATLATIVGTYLMTRDSGKFEGFFYDFTSLNVILASLAAFLLLRGIAEHQGFTSPKVQNSLRWLASASFGIYLVHILVIEILQSKIPGFHLDTFIGNPLWSIPLVTAIVFLLSLAIARVLQKVPVIERIIP